MLNCIYLLFFISNTRFCKFSLFNVYFTAVDGNKSLLSNICIFILGWVVLYSTSLNTKYKESARMSTGISISKTVI